MSKSKRFFTIKEVNQHIKNLLNGDSLLSNLWVKGEISNFKLHSSGHMYFTLKDDSGTLRCVMFRSRAQKVNFRPAHGMQVLAAGYVSVYERDGQYQLYVEEMLPDGAGTLHLAYEQLKDRLSKEGLFEQDKKRPLPFLPASIGIVTSFTGAALRDILSIVKRRCPQTKIIIAPAVVQGGEAPASICKALEQVYRQSVDVIIVGRGGGSLEELWCFNDEDVVRKISVSPVPIISAVGHETDFTLADFAADCRAATPSMAAELVVPLKEELQNKIAYFKASLFNSMQYFLGQERQRVEYLANSQVMREPIRIIANKHQELDSLTARLLAESKNKLNSEQGKLSLLTGKLDTLSPLKTMARGYSLCFKTTGEMIKSVDQVDIEETIQISLFKGQLTCSVKRKEGGHHGKKDKL